MVHLRTFTTTGFLLFKTLINLLALILLLQNQKLTAFYSK